MLRTLRWTFTVPLLAAAALAFSHLARAQSGGNSPWYVTGHWATTPPGHVVAEHRSPTGGAPTYSLTLNADGQTHSNSCWQAMALGGRSWSVAVSPASRTINVALDGFPGGACTTEYSPVTGLIVAGGYLAPGLWTINLPRFSESYQFTIGATFPPGGDFTADNHVDGADFLRWQQHLGADGGRSHGDADNSGLVDAADLQIWRAEFASQTAPTSVPEPTSLSLLWLVSLAAAARRQ